MSFEPIEDKRDMVCTVAALLLLVVGVLAFLGITVPFLVQIVAVLFILGGLFCLFDAFSVDGILKLAYIVLFIVLITMGVSVFVTIPVVGAVFSLAFVGVTQLIVNVIVILALLAVAFQSF